MGEKQRLPAPPGMKRCFDCLHVRPLSEFHADKTRYDGKNTRCKPCMSDHMRVTRYGGERKPHDGIDERRREVDLVNGQALVDGLKYCPKCEKRKAPEEFDNHAHTKTKLSTYCTECLAQNFHRVKAEKPEQFARRVEYNKKYMRDNREKYVARLKTWAQKYPEKHKAAMRKNNLKKRWGLTVEQFDEMLAEQGGKCANPGCSYTGENNGRSRCFVVDHCHTSGQIRGILCNTCNLALGNCYDDSRALAGLASYAARYELGIQ